MKFFIILPFFLLVSFSETLLFGQSNPSYSDYRYIDIRGHAGANVYTGNTLAASLLNTYRSIEIRYGWQSSNPNSWQSMYRYPSYGIGWFNGFPGNPDIIGRPAALFGFISFPLFEYSRLKIFLEPSLGVVFNIKPYDPEINALNDALGSSFGAFVGLSLGSILMINNKIDFLSGFNFTHFSNGRTFNPNYGLNMFGVNAGVRYNFNVRVNNTINAGHSETYTKYRPVTNVYNQAESIKKGYLLFYVAAGTVQNEADQGTRIMRPTFSSTLEYQYRTNSKSSFSGGFDIFYDSSLFAFFPNESYFFYGIHAGYDYTFWKLSLRFQLGTYITEKGHRFRGHYFLRPAIQYKMTDHSFLQLGIKSKDGRAADWLELGIGVII